MDDRNAGRFGRASAGAPFMVYNLTNYSVRQYAVSPGDQLTDTWPVTDKAAHHFCVYGPNGFFWEFMGRGGHAPVGIERDDGAARPRRRPSWSSAYPTYSRSR